MPLMRGRNSRPRTSSPETSQCNALSMITLCDPDRQVARCFESASAPAQGAASRHAVCDPCFAEDPFEAAS